MLYFFAKIVPIFNPCLLKACVSKVLQLFKKGLEKTGLGQLFHRCYSLLWHSIYSDFKFLFAEAYDMLSFNFVFVFLLL